MDPNRRFLFKPPADHDDERRLPVPFIQLRSFFFVFCGALNDAEEVVSVSSIFKPGLLGVVPGSAALVSLDSLREMKIFRPLAKPTKSESLSEGGGRNLEVDKFSR